MNKNIAILGFGGNCDSDIIELSTNIAGLIAKENWIVMTGGIGGVFQAARKSAIQCGGVALSVIEKENKPDVKYYSAILPVSSTSLKRILLVEAADAAIIIGGWLGTLDLAVQMVSYKKPVVAIGKSGGVANCYGGQYLIQPNGGYIELAKDYLEAFNKLIGFFK